MRFIVDAQLPRRLAREITSLGGDAVHTLDLPSANRTSDAEILRLAMETRAVVITKDSDFVDDFLLKGEPPQLVFVTTGNIPNIELIELFRANWSILQSMLSQGDFVELSRTAVTLHS